MNSSAFALHATLPSSGPCKEYSSTLAIESFLCTVQLNSLTSYLPSPQICLGFRKSYHISFSDAWTILGERRAFRIITPGSDLTHILLFKIFESKETGYCIKALFSSLFPDRKWSPGLMGHMFGCFLATLNEAITREGLPLSCRRDFILTVPSFPHGLGGSGWPVGHSL